MSNHPPKYKSGKKEKIVVFLRRERKSWLLAGIRKQEAIGECLDWSESRMRQLGRLLRPVANQTGNPTALWQDPIHGYWETHGKMEFKPGEDYNLSDEEKQVARVCILA